MVTQALLVLALVLVVIIVAQATQSGNQRRPRRPRAAGRSKLRSAAAKAKIGSYVWTCIGDPQSCPNCRAHDGKEWRRKKDISPSPPLKSCTSPQGCRCAIVPVYDDEGAVYLE